VGSSLSIPLIAAALVCSLTSGCAENEGDLPGEVQLQLSLPSGVTVNSIAWNVLSATEAVLASGTTNTSGTRATPSLSVSVPPGTGEKVSVTATTTAGASCAGTSDPFNVTRGSPVSVSLVIACTSPPPSTGLGTVVVTAVVDPNNYCPTLTSWGVSPRQGGGFDVSVSTTSIEGDTVTYAWTATDGSFVDPAAASTQYACNSSGLQTLSVAISGSSCALHLSLPPVDCP
jgi:hypothetical protein